MTENDTDLLHHLQILETELHRPDVRSDPGRLNALLHDEFVEFGRTGNIYTKSETIRRLPTDSHCATILADQFLLRRLGSGAALLTYRSAQRAADGTLEKQTVRASIWQHSGSGWQLSFHQGTATSHEM